MNLRSRHNRTAEKPRLSREQVTDRIMNTAAALGGVATGLFAMVVGTEIADQHQPSLVETHVIDSTVQQVGNTLDPSTAIESAIQHFEEKNHVSYDTENSIQKEADEVTDEILVQTGRESVWPSDAVKVVLLTDIQGNYYVDADPVALAEANAISTSTDGSK